MTATIRSTTISVNDVKTQGGKVQNIHKLDPSAVHVWSIAYNENFQELFREYRTVLSQKEFYKARKFYRANDFKRYLSGRIVLRILLGRYLACDPSKVELDYYEGKPYLPNSSIKFNLSYSEKHVFISIGFCDTGIDIEAIKPDFDLRDILGFCFSADEIADIDQDCQTSKERFFLQWTRKEALLKYTGQGIIDDLTIVPSTDGVHNNISHKLKIRSDLNLLSFKPHHDLVGTLAYPFSVINVEFFEWRSQQNSL